MFDIKKAFDNVDRPRLWKILFHRAKKDTEKVIIERLINLHTQTKIFVGEEYFYANKGVP